MSIFEVDIIAKQFFSLKKSQQFLLLNNSSKIKKLVDNDINVEKLLAMDFNQQKLVIKAIDIEISDIHHYESAVDMIGLTTEIIVPAG